MGQGSSSPPSVLFPPWEACGRWRRRCRGANLPAITTAQGQGIRTKCGMTRTKCVSACDLTAAGNSGVAAGEAEAGFHLGDLGAANRHAVRRRSIQLDHGAIALLADEGDMRDRDDMTAMHPN